MRVDLPGKASVEPKRVLFVCNHGVASRLAASRFKELLREHGLESNFEVDNAALNRPQELPEKLLDSDHVVAMHIWSAEDLRELRFKRGARQYEWGKLGNYNRPERIFEKITGKKILARRAPWFVR